MCWLLTCFASAVISIEAADLSIGSSRPLFQAIYSAIASSTIGSLISLRHCGPCISRFRAISDTFLVTIERTSPCFGSRLEIFDTTFRWMSSSTLSSPFPSTAHCTFSSTWLYLYPFSLTPPLSCPAYCSHHSASSEPPIMHSLGPASRLSTLAFVCWARFRGSRSSSLRLLPRCSACCNSLSTHWTCSTVLLCGVAAIY